MNYQRFVVFLVSLLMCVAIGVTVYYFMKDEEYIFLQTQEVNVNVGDKFALEYKHENPLDSTKIEWEIKNTDLVTYDEETGLFTAIAGGTTEIWLNTTRKDWKIQQCFVKIGDGSAENPTIISDVNGLQNIATNGHYILISDIDLQGQDWQPLCSAGAFAGELDGNGHTIKNLTVTANTGIVNAGLFGELTYKAYVHDLTLDTVNISGNIENVGAVAGTNKGLIEKVRATNVNLSSWKESTTPRIGGIAGVTFAYAEASATPVNYDTIGRIDRCEVSNATLYSGKNAHIGGLTARLEGGFVLNSFFVGSIVSATSADTVGAGIVVSMIATQNSNAKIKDNYAVVTFSNVAKKAGVVYANEFNAYKAPSTDTIISENIIWGQYFDATVCGDASVKAIVSTGYSNENEFNNRVSDGKIVASGVATSFLQMAGNDQTTIYSHTNYKGLEFFEKVYNYDFLITWKIEAGVNNGYPSLQMGGKADDAIINITGTEEPEEPIDPEDPIDTRSLLQRLQDCKEGETIALGDDLDWAYKNWEPVGTESAPFNGTFDGRGKVVSNIKIVDGSEFKGLFGVLGDKAKITNITFKNVKILNAEGFDYVGIVAGMNNGGTISNVTIENFEIVNGKNVGGVVGYNGGLVDGVKVINTDSTFKNININNNEVAKVGGIVGVNKGTVVSSKCLVELTVQKSGDSDTFVGGIIGDNSGYVNDVICKSNILSQANANRVGGIIGYNTGNVVSVAYKGSITAKTNSSNVYLGGIAGFNILNGRIEKSSVQGTFTAYNVGGLVAYNGNNETYISQCNVFDATLVGEQVGGFISTMSLGKMENCSVVATIRGNSSNAVKAGFAVVVAGGTDSKGKGDCARIENCFVGVTYEGEGTNWAETTSSIRVSLANSNAYKQGGFIKNCVYDSTLANGAKTQGGSTTLFGNNNSGNYDGNRYDNLDGRASTEDCYKASTYSKDNRNWDNVNIWSLGNASYPKVKTAKTID